MEIIDNWLENVERIIPPPKYSAGSNICDLIILHYTGAHFESSINTLNSENSQVSWHITVDRNGKAYQHYDFRKRCWHAGSSSWFEKSISRTYEGINKYGIGIEMINYGKLIKKNVEFYTWYEKKVPEKEVFIDSENIPWHKYTENQIKTVKNLCKVLTRNYKCVNILPHSDIKASKNDTGKAFEQHLGEIHEEIFGRKI